MHAPSPAAAEPGPGAAPEDSPGPAPRPPVTLAEVDRLIALLLSGKPVEPSLP